MIYTSLIAVSTAAVALATPLSTNWQYNPQRTEQTLRIAPLHKPGESHVTVNSSYIVVLKPELSLAVLDNHLNFLQSVNVDQFDGESGIKHIYSTDMMGYAGVFSDSALEMIRAMPEVDFVEHDSIVTTMDPPDTAGTLSTQKGAPWGLARISHRKRLGLGTYSKYEFDSNGGEGVDVYVIDTGINIKHVDLEGRGVWGKTIPQNDEDIDGNGHGSHCSGTIAGKTYGVAKKATVIAVKVLGTNGSGTMSDVVAGVDWASKSAQAKAKLAEAELAATGKTKHKGSVANMSLGGGKSRALDIAVNNAVTRGMHFAVAAGNDNKDACDYSPAAAELAVTVGASTLSDERAYFSNHGKCVDVFAPGLNIKSIYNTNPRAIATLSGTSMASPHVAGLLAYYLSIHGTETFDPVLKTFTPPSLDSEETVSIYTTVYNVLPSFISGFLPPPRLVISITAPVPPRKITTAQLKAALISLSTEGVLSDLPKETVNKLIFNNATSI